jgi:predicted Fe-Mo cluster-binding NifX family protein
MKLAISARGNDLRSEVESRFGRAKRFIVLDTDTGEYRVLENLQNQSAAQGAGIQAAQAVADLQVDAVITGHCGPKAFRVLQAAGIQVYLEQEGSVEAAAARVVSGQTRKAETHDVEGHW